jgi:hypothetical protein
MAWRVAATAPGIRRYNSDLGYPGRVGNLTHLTQSPVTIWRIDAAAGRKQQLHRIHIALAGRLHDTQLCLLMQTLRIQHLQVSGVARRIASSRKIERCARGIQCLPLRAQ